MSSTYDVATVDSDDTPPTDAPEAAAPPDVFTSTVMRYSFMDDDSYANAIERARERRNIKADAHARLASTVVEHDLPFPSIDLYAWDRKDGASVVARYRVDDLDRFRVMARAVRRAVGGLQTKSNDDGSLTATVNSGPLAWEVVLAAEASPCEQVEVGKETRVEREEITPPRYREVEKEVPVYEWRCPPSVLDEELLAEAEAAATDVDDA